MSSAELIATTAPAGGSNPEIIKSLAAPDSNPNTGLLTTPDLKRVKSQLDNGPMPNDSENCLRTPEQSPVKKPNRPISKLSRAAVEFVPTAPKLVNLQPQDKNQVIVEKTVLDTRAPPKLDDTSEYPNLNGNACKGGQTHYWLPGSAAYVRGNVENAIRLQEEQKQRQAAEAAIELHKQLKAEEAKKQADANKTVQEIIFDRMTSDKNDLYFSSDEPVSDHESDSHLMGEQFDDNIAMFGQYDADHQFIVEEIEQKEEIQKPHVKSVTTHGDVFVTNVAVKVENFVYNTPKDRAVQAECIEKAKVHFKRFVDKTVEIIGSITDRKNPDSPIVAKTKFSKKAKKAQAALEIEKKIPAVEQQTANPDDWLEMKMEDRLKNLGMLIGMDEKSFAIAIDWVRAIKNQHESFIRSAEGKAEMTMVETMVRDILTAGSGLLTPGSTVRLLDSKQFADKFSQLINSKSAAAATGLFKEWYDVGAGIVKDGEPYVGHIAKLNEAYNKLVDINVEDRMVSYRNDVDNMVKHGLTRAQTAWSQHLAALRVMYSPEWIVNQIFAINRARNEAIGITYCAPAAPQMEAAPRPQMVRKSSRPVYDEMAVMIQRGRDKQLTTIDPVGWAHLVFSYLALAHLKTEKMRIATDASQKIPIPNVLVPGTFVTIPMESNIFHCPYQPVSECRDGTRCLRYRDQVLADIHNTKYEGPVCARNHGSDPNPLILNGKLVQQCAMRRCDNIKGAHWCRNPAEFNAKGVHVYHGPVPSIEPCLHARDELTCLRNLSGGCDHHHPYPAQAIMEALVRGLLVAADATSWDGFIIKRIARMIIDDRPNGVWKDVDLRIGRNMKHLIGEFVFPPDFDKKKHR